MLQMNRLSTGKQTNPAFRLLISMNGKMTESDVHKTSDDSFGMPKFV